MFSVALLAMIVAFLAGFGTADHVRSTPWVSQHLAFITGQQAPPAPSASVSGTVSGTLAVGTPGTGAVPAVGGAAGAPADFGLFWDTLVMIDQDEAGAPPTPDDVTYGAIRGSLQSLDDPFTAFSDPVDTAVSSPELEGAFEGIGAYVTTAPDGRLMIQTPMRGQPAEKAGLRAGDIIIKVDDQSIVGMDVSKAVLLIRGPKGTTVRLTVVREGVAQPFVLPVVRERIEIPSVDGVTTLADRGAPQVGYFQLTVFATETRSELDSAIADLRKSGAKALVMDLRNNPGGYLNSALDVASEFIGSGVIVFQEDNKGHRTPMDARPGGHALDLPLVVLVNRGSASASEIVAGAIRDHKRGVLVGETTFGKGSVQNVHKLSDGSELRVTVAVWLTPNGTLIHKKGIVPDVVVPGPAAAQAQPSATPGPAGLATAAATANPGAGTPSATPTEVPDPQLDRAAEEALRLLEKTQ